MLFLVCEFPTFTVKASALFTLNHQFGVDWFQNLQFSFELELEMEKKGFKVNINGLNHTN